MADDKIELSSAFPEPPQEYKLFTKEARDAYNDGNIEHIEAEVLELFKPPELPTEAYTTFGERWPLEAKLPALQEAGIQQLYPDEPIDRVDELKGLSQSLLLNFFDIVGVMGTAPETFPPKLEYMRTIMLNMHHLINEYRPHQTRETVAFLMEQQLDRRRQEIAEIETVCTKARNLLKQYGKIFDVPPEDVEMAIDPTDPEQELEKDRDLRLWREIL